MIGWELLLVAIIVQQLVLSSSIGYCSAESLAELRREYARNFIDAIISEPARRPLLDGCRVSAAVPRQSL